MITSLTSIPLAWVAGVLGILSPCVWPIIPVVMGSAASSGSLGPLFFGLGLTTSFAIAGTFLTFILLNMGISPDAFRYFGAGFLLLIAAVLLIKPLGDWVIGNLSKLTSRYNPGVQSKGISVTGQFFIGMTLGLVWLPCVGPTVGAAVALASVGQNMTTAFAVMFAFGLGTATALLLAGMSSKKLLSRWRPGILNNAQTGKKILGWMLLVMGLLVVFGLDRDIESWMLRILPESLIF